MFDPPLAAKDAILVEKGPSWNVTVRWCSEAAPIALVLLAPPDTYR